MKILIVSARDLRGGAARAAYRLHQGLLATQTDSQMLVQNKLSDSSSVIAPKSKIKRGIAAMKPALDQLLLNLYPNRDRSINIYSSQWLPNQTLEQIEQLNPDLINLHWINGGFLTIEALAKLKRPLVWTLHDMWAFTGGCHYSGKCDRYQQACGACPQLGSEHQQDLSHWNWQRKSRAWRNLNLTIVTPSQWLASCAQSSSLLSDFPIKVIGNGIDPLIYQPHDSLFARKVFNLPTNKKIVLFGALDSIQDQRKGFKLLLAALKHLKSLPQAAAIELVIFGASAPNQPTNFGFSTHYVGQLSDDVALSLLYASADVFVAPSVQDNLPNTVLEALFSGTPCTAFKIGGMPDLIEHQHNGYLAQAEDPQDLAQGIAWVLQDESRHQQLKINSRAKAVTHFNLAQQTQKYLRVFTELCSNLTT